MTLAWPQWPHTTTNPSLPDMLMTPGTSHNNQSLADRHADDPGDDRDTLSILQNEHLSQKKIKHQQQCHPVTAQHQELHPPISLISYSPLSVHTQAEIQLTYLHVYIFILQLPVLALFEKNIPVYSWYLSKLFFLQMHDYMINIIFVKELVHLYYSSISSKVHAYINTPNNCYRSTKHTN